MKKYAYGELGKNILLGLAAGGLIATVCVLPGLPVIFNLFKTNSSRDRYRMRQAIKGLQKKRLVRLHEHNGEEVVEITEAGKKKILAYNLDDMRLKVPKRWDGWWRIVMFDIPEPRKTARNALSKKVRELGLYAIQKSVFVSPYPCNNEIDFVGEFFGVRKNIIYIKAKEIEGAPKLKRHFGIA